MKWLTLFFVFLLFIVISSPAFCQSGFMIGADWINHPGRPGGVPHVPSSTDWANITDLGLKWGTVTYLPEDNVSYANSALTGAESNNIKLMLARYKFQGPSAGQKWEYHPEYNQHYPAASRRGEAVSDIGATRFPDDNNITTNAWKAEAGRHSAGYITTGLIPNTEQEDGSTYYVKLRIRLPDLVPLDATPVCTLKVVRISDGYEKTAVILANQCSHSYTEVFALSFNKNSSGSLLVAGGNTTASAAQENSFPANHAHSGIPQQTVSLLATGTAFDYRVYWPGNVTCYLDCILVEDGIGNNVFAGYYDTDINDEVDLFKSRSGLGRFKVRDEMDPEFYGSYLCVGYIENKIKENVLAAGYSTKTGIHYNNGYWQIARGGNDKYIGRDIAWTRNNQLLTDIYPIGSAAVLPDNSLYTSSFQNRMQSDLINYIRPNITYANQYSVPLWFAPQVHQVNEGPNQLREPTTLELQLMINLALAYGAKGINYFLYWSWSDYDYLGLVNTDGTPRRTIYPGTSYSGDKWATVKAINQKLSGTLGETLMNLTWQSAFSIHLGQPTGSYITSITTTDATNERYVELSLFSDASSNDYFMIVNRRTKNTESRDVTVNFNKNSSYTTWKVAEVGTNNYWFVSNTGCFQTTYSPGEGKLFKFEPLLANSSETFNTANIVINNSVTVASGKTLNIGSGSTLKLENSTSLTVNGTLNITGTSAANVVLDFVAATTSPINCIWANQGSVVNMDYTEIKNSALAIWASDAEVHIDHCNFHNMIKPIYFYNLLSNNYGSTIRNTYITNSSSEGIWLRNSSALLENNKISSNAGEGVRILSYSDPVLSRNTIENNNNGLTVQMYCMPSLNGYNLIKNNTYNAIYAYYYATILAGFGAYGFNTFQTPGGYNIYETYYSQIYALNNYWGQAPPDVNQFYADGTCYLNYNNWLSSDAGSGSSLLKVVNNPNLQFAYNEMAEGRYDDAEKIFKKTLNDNTNETESNYALSGLRACYSKSKKEGFYQYLETDIKPKVDNKKSGLSRLYLDLHANCLIQEGKYNDALTDLKSIRDNYTLTSEVKKELNFQEGLINLVYQKNVETGKQIFEKIKRDYPDEKTNFDVDVLLAAYNNGGFSLNKNSNSEQVGKVSDSSLEYGLVQNYPNPFNPTTNISFSLPQRSNVKLVVYDVLGKEVATLANSVYEAGKYSVQFNGSSLASGMYFYTLTTSQGTITKKMLLVK